MSRVSLIPLAQDRVPWSADRLQSFRRRLEQAGYPAIIEPGRADQPSQAGSAADLVARIGAATGSYLILVDQEMPYSPDDVLAVVRRLDEGRAELVVAARRGRWCGRLTRRVAGTADIDSGLSGLTRAAGRRVGPTFAPVGGRVACELFAHVAGDRMELEVPPFAGAGGTWTPIDAIRQAKRIADRRLGNLSRFVQFCAVGASGMVVDLSTYAALQALLARTWLGERALFQPGAGGASTSLAVATAAVLAIVTAMTWNFSLNRRLTFNDARRGSIGRQYLRYALSNTAGCGLSLAFRLLLPTSIPFFARHRLAAAVAGIVAATGVSFTLARWFVFGVRTPRPRSGPERPPLADPAPHDVRSLAFASRPQTTQPANKCSEPPN